MSDFFISKPQVEEALLKVGCARRSPGVFALAAKPPLALYPLRLAGGWWRWLSSPVKAGHVAPAAVLDAPAPSGPFKWLAAKGKKGLRLAADLPECFEDDAAAMGILEDGLAEALPDGSSGGQAPGHLEVWAEDLVSALRRFSRGDGCSPSIAKPQSPGADLVDWLARRGWLGSLDGDEIRIQMTGPQYCNTVHLQASAPAGGLALDMELAEVNGWGEESLAAAALLAQEAGERLRLVRLALVQQSERRYLSAQVHLGRLPARSPWLPLALDALRAAACVLAKEAPALADPDLARWILFRTFGTSRKEVNHGRDA
ncbi:MAG: hypothetical protein HY717_13045 [Planctomycetes bacterium]|nr:hypothetical protein [Planctomycetota bacterium]